MAPAFPMRTIAIAALAICASGAQPRFEVASLKVSPVAVMPRFGPGMAPGAQQAMNSRFSPRLAGGPGTEDPGQVTCADCPLPMLIGTAYEVDSSRIRAPEWLYPQRCDIVAKLPTGSTRHDLHLMLQALLAERYELQLHREPGSGDVFALVVGKEGSRLQTVGDGSGRMPQPHLTGLNLLMLTGHNNSMKQLADALSSYVDRPVFDQTGMKGGYDFSLVWVADPTMPLPRKRDLPFGLKSAPHYPKNAVRMQLGLKLEGRKGPVDIVVIDSALRVPIEN